MTSETTTILPAPLPVLTGGNELGSVLRDYMEVAGRLQQTHETLQREVVRLRQELASKDRELERRRRLSALGELAAGVAHEVRNPLGAIQLYSDLLRRECDRHSFMPAFGLLEKIDAGIRAIDGVVHDTLTLAPRDRKLSAHSVRDIIERAEDSAAGVLQRRAVAVTIHNHAPEANVIADAAGLTRVVINLLTNAAEASAPGDTITVTVEQVDGEQVMLAVADQGCGIPETVIDRLFDPFFTTKENGTGLGLSIAHRLIEAFGGQLIARNRPEGGAEFVLYLRDGRALSTAASEDSTSRQTTAA